ncbi:unnamed protein product [Diamesa hyperborea]
MSDVEVAEPKKGRGRPKVTASAAEPAKKAVVEAPAKDSENGASPAKRGRGRPAKGSKKGKVAAVAVKRPASGKGRGRPAKAKKPESAEESAEAEESE